MAYGESKAKLGNRGSMPRGKTFNKASGTHSSTSHNGLAGSYQGTTKGKTKHIKPKG